MGPPKQWNSYQSSNSFLCFESPTALFASKHCLFRTTWPERAQGLLTQIKTYHTVYQRHVDMLTKIPRQPFLIPLDTSHVWFLTRNSTHIKGQKMTDDLFRLVNLCGPTPTLGNKCRGNEAIFLNMHVLSNNSHDLPYWYQDQSHQCWCTGDDQKYAGSISKYVLQSKRKTTHK